MAFPSILFGPDSEIFNTYTGNAVTAATNNERQNGFRPGQRMILKDGREFRWAKNGATAQVAGQVVQASVPITNHVALAAATAGAVGDTTLSLTLGATAVQVDQYREGYVAIHDAATGLGYAYPIGPHAGVASSGTFAVPLDKGFKLLTVVSTTASAISLVANPYYGVIIGAVSASQTAQLVGVALTPMAANAWGWIQTRGPAMVVVEGTWVLGNPLGLSTSAAGAMSPIPTTFTANQNTSMLARAIRLGATTKAGFADLIGFA